MKVYPAALAVFIAIFLYEPIAAQFHLNYRRLVPGGLFRVPTFWTPFNPVNQPPILGPGGDMDRAIFDLGNNFNTIYTVTEVNGINERLIIGTDAVRLEIVDYELVGNRSIVLGESPGDIAILELAGGPGAHLRCDQCTELGFASGSRGTLIVNSPDLIWDTGGIDVELGNLVLLSGTVNSGYFYTDDSFSGAEVTGNQSVLNLVEFDLENSASFLMVEDGGVVNTEFVCVDGLPLISIRDPGSTLTTEDILSCQGASFEISEGGALISLLLDVIDTTFLVSGNGSIWMNQGDICMGSNDDAQSSIVVLDGGMVTANRTILSFISDSVSCIRVEDAGSVFDCVGLIIGERGDGIMDVLDGGRVESSFSVAGESIGSFADICVSGNGSSWINATNLEVGRLGTALMAIEDGGSVASTTGTIGNNAIGEVTIRDSGSSWISTGSLEIGVSNSGGMSVQNGAQVISSGESVLGFATDSNGFVEVIGAGSRWSNDGTIRVGNFGQAELSIENGGSVDCDQFILGDSGIVELLGGTLTANSISFDGGEFTFNGGTLHVGTFDQSLINDGGVLAPGRADGSAGMTQINGLYSPRNGAVLEIGIGGTEQATEYDFAQSLGDTTLDGDLRVQLIDGFEPANKQDFEVYNVTSGDLLGAFSNVPDGERLTTVGGEGSFLVTYGFQNQMPKKVILSDFQLSFIPGDVNGDGAVDLSDIAPFIELLSTGEYLPAADINQDGLVNLTDIPLFVQLLSG